MPKKSKSEQIGVRYKPEDILNTKTPDFRSIYSNNVAFAISAFDVSLIFGEIAGNEEGKLHVEQMIRVTMSPQHAKVLALIMMENIKTYETTVGPITIPTQLPTTTDIAGGLKKD